MKPLSIKYWSEDERPREKLIHQGRKNLTNAELLAILIGAGTTNLSALQVARNILATTGNNLHALGKLSVKELCTCKGIGPAKAVGLVAAFEIGRRREISEIRKRKKIQSSKEAFQVLAPILKDNYVEEFWVVLLNRANEYLRSDKLSMGGVSGTVVDAKVVFKLAIDQLASSIILFHNHPSGNLKPSQCDLDITKNLVKAGKVLDIKVIDHLIISEKGYFSFADEGYL